MSNQPSAVPTRKVGAGALGGAVVVVAAWILEATVGIEMPAPVVAALTTIVIFAFSYFVPERHV
jgi:hypothetical protein